MRIVVLGTRGFPDVQGGVEKHCEELYPRLTSLGAEVIVITRKSYIKKKRESFNGVRFIHLYSPKLKSLEAISHTFLALFKLKKLKPDIVHVHSIGPAFLIPLIKLSGYKVVMTHHGPDYMRKKWGAVAKLVLRTGEKNAMKYSDKVIVIAKWVQDYIEKKYKRQSYFIPNGVSPVNTDTGYLNNGSLILKKFNIEPKKYVFTAARFVPEKGLDDLISAYRFLENPEFKLVIAGDADHKTYYSKTLKELANKTNGVILTGTVHKEDIYKLYSNAALFVLPSYYEGFPISLLEALSFGVPVLVSDIPAHNEILLPDFRYFHAGDVQELSKKIEECVQEGIDANEEKMYIDLIKTNYDWDIIAKKTLSVYKECVGD
jgi:glycosyltransferase involved in cell wall biosynthesis